MLSSIESFQDFHPVKELVLSSFPVMDSEAITFPWKHQFLTQSLPHYGEQPYHGHLEVEKENSTLKKRIQELENPPKCRPGYLPSAGHAWQSKSDINSHFASCTAAEKARKKEKLEKLRNDLPHFEKILGTAIIKFQD